MNYGRRALAVRTAKLRSKATHPTSDVGHCLREVRECFAIQALAPTALEAFWAAKTKHHVFSEQEMKDIPRGVPVFWKGSKPIFIHGLGLIDPGHVAISTGWGTNCFSVDILRDGYFDKVKIEFIHNKWGLKLLGWTEDLNGVRVYP